MSKWDCQVALSVDLSKNMKLSAQKQESSCLNLLGGGYLDMDYSVSIWHQYFRSIFRGLRKGGVTTAHCDPAGLEVGRVGRTNMSMWCSKPAMGQRLRAEGWAEAGKAAWKACVCSLKGYFLKRDGGRSQWVLTFKEVLSCRSLFCRLVLFGEALEKGTIQCGSQVRKILTLLTWLQNSSQVCWLQDFKYLIYENLLYTIDSNFTYFKFLIQAHTHLRMYVYICT